ncbi:hypothetical protein O0L34_g17708 [Tuta absoluta]|nr:hypothetical protein O0L34_g17708 [Tuta absoluta]
MDILAKHQEHKDFVGFWNSTKKLNYKMSLPVSVEKAQSPKEIADTFATHFKATPLPAQHAPDVCPPPRASETVTLRFSPTDVAKALKKMKRGKSPGHDGLSIEHLEYASDELYRVLSELFNLCLRFGYLPKALMRTVVVPVPKNKTGDLASVGNYRPISLGTVIGKVLERLIHPHMMKPVRISDAQFGFRAGVSTDSAIFCLKNTVKYYTSRETSVYACFLDLSRAFDLVNYDLLWSKLTAAGVSDDILNLLKHWYGNQTNTVKWGDTESSVFRLDCGVRQGGLTSPDLFNIYVNALIEELRDTRIGCHVAGVCTNNLSYADDMVLLSPSIAGLRKLLSICERYATEHGLKYNVKKTEMLVFRCGRGLETVPSVYLDGAQVRRVAVFRYLGHMLTEDLKDDDDIERERRALAVRCNMLARRFHRCTSDVKKTLFRAYCQNMYTCHLWFAFNRRSYSTIRVQYNDSYRTLMRLPRYCSASSMFADARIPDFFAIMRARIASFLERIGSSQNDIVRAMYDSLDTSILRYWMTSHCSENKK